MARVQNSWLFANQASFVELALTTVAPARAVKMHELAKRVVYFSPEARVTMKLVESVELLGRKDEAVSKNCDSALRFRFNTG